MLDGMRRHVSTMPDDLLLRILSRWQYEKRWMEEQGGWRYSRASLNHAIEVGFEECMVRNLTYGEVA